MSVVVSSVIEHEPLIEAPVSSGQRRLWFLHQLDPASTAYNSVHEVSFGCRVDLGILSDSINYIVRRHEILRTCFKFVEGDVVQIVDTPFRVSIPIRDLRAIPPSAQGPRRCEEVAELSSRAFDLAELPLFRAVLLRLDHEQDVLLIQLHHVVADGESAMIFLQELESVYSSYGAGRPVELPQLPLQYKDYALWQQQWLRTEAPNRQLAYWRAQLKDPPPRLGLQQDEISRADHPTGVVSFEMSAALLLHLKRVAQRESVTPFMLLLAGFNALLFRYTGQQDLIVGTPIAGRRREFQKLIGFFVNTLPLRTRVSGETSFRRLLLAIRTMCLQGYANQELPFDRIVEDLQPERILDTTPLFQVLLTMHPAAGRKDVAWSFKDLAAENQHPQFDLAVAITATDSRLSVQLTYRASRFDPRRMENMAAHYQQFLLYALTEGFDQPIEAVPILRETEKQRLVKELNATAAEYDRALCLHGFFERQVAKTPDWAALLCGGSSLTYRELNEQADVLARALRSKGVGPEVRVGLFLRRSARLVTAVLAVLKAGGAYVPLDPAYPVQRLKFILQDADVRIVITEAAVRESLGQVLGESTIQCVVMSEEQHESMEQETTSQHAVSAPFLCPARPANLAYIIYTSGSTGAPKGVAVTHSNAVNFISWALRAFPASDLAAVVASTSICFDLSIFEIFAPLSSGGRVLVVENALQLPRETWAQSATLLNTVPSAAQELLQESARPALRVLNLAGEPFTAALLEGIRRKSFAQRVLNLYGPSETTTYSTFASAEDAEVRAVPIGRPIDNTQVYVLDPLCQPVPMGVAGELYVGGAGVTRGYVGRGELTAERYVPDEFGGEAGGRLYRTGDRVRYRLDGQLEFLGRVDQQVKIRGYRIELGEIEAVLQGHARVREAVVAVRERGEERQLVAYVVRESEVQPQESQAAAQEPGAAAQELGAAARVAGAPVAGPPTGVSIAELREYLRTKLPCYMVPEVVSFLEKLPLTANGKVDRKRLPEPQQQPEAEDYVAPRDATEELIGGIWQELLGLPRISIHANFFELGGHSILATRAIARIRAALGVERPLRMIFEWPTIAGLSEQLRNAGAEEVAPVAVERLERVVESAGSQHAGHYLLPASYGQQRIWFLHELSPASSVAYHVCGGLRIEGPLRAAELAAALQQLVDRHESLRTGLAVVESELRQVVAQQAEIALPCVDLRGYAESEQQARLREMEGALSRQSFDLGRGPLVRASLVRLREEQHVLLLTAHHIICDGWSVGVFVNELLRTYARGSGTGERLTGARLTGELLGESPLQYAEFAHWQRQWMESQQAAQQLEFWKQELAGTPPVLELPVDYGRGAVQGFAGGLVHRGMSRELLGQLREVGRRGNATLYMTLLGAFQVLLHRYSGEQDIWVGTPIANRMRQEWAGLIGFFSNTLVMRTEVTGDLPFTEVLERVRATTLRAYAHQELPFERLVQELQPQRDLGRTPLFQVMFALEEAEVSRGSEIAGLRIQPEVLDNGTAKFDLALFMGESEAGLTARLEYNAGLFEPGTATLLLQHLERLLEAIAANAGERVARLDLLPPQERRQVVREWNATGRAYRGGRQLQELFEEQVRKDPQALALVCAGERLSYEELNQRANQLGWYLREQGVGPEIRVGLCVERSLEMVVGQLGVLKAGGAYVPLDAEYPPERLRYMLEDAQAPLLLTQARLLERLPEVAGVRRICLDTGWEEISRRLARNVERVGSTANLAYVIYTSGSTGQPKGVMVTHANLNNLAQWHGEAFGIGEQDRGSCVAGLGFDASVWEVWPYLVKGASLAVPAEPTRRDPEQLQEWLQAAGVTVAFIPTALAEVMLGQKWPAGIRLRTVLTGGDQLRRRPATGLPWRLSNNYGPTEGTVVASSGWVEPENAQEAREAQEAQEKQEGRGGWEGQGGHEAQGSQGKREGRKVPSIGRPVANAQLYVLDPEMQPVAVGVAGELYVGGAGVTRGYVGRGELTAERYVPDEFGGEAGGRLYRTGDRVRYRLDGQLEFLGRVDQQVKIRGYRIELGEIEAVLQGHARVREAVVAVRERGEERQLVAYVVRESEAQPQESRAATPVIASPAGVSIAELREYLRSKLPCYMVPEVVSFLEKLPLTANGKVDRKRLPEPQQQPEAEDYVAPRDATEELISGIWQELLGLPRISIHANFFELGGHSILATRAIARIRAALGVERPLRMIFEWPTIAGLSEQLRNAGAEEVAPVAVERLERVVESAGSQHAGHYLLPASYGQQRIWFLHELSPASSVAYHVCGGLRIEGPLRVVELEAALQQLVDRHESLRTGLAVVESELRQVVAQQAEIALPCVDLRGYAESEQQARLREMEGALSRQSFDLGRGPLVRASLVRLREEQHVLLLTAHHIICDGWSVGVFVNELLRTYARGSGTGERLTGVRLTGEQLTGEQLTGEQLTGELLGESPLQYAEFAHWQRQWMESQQAAQQLEFWKQELAGTPPVLELPVDYGRGAVQGFAGGLVHRGMSRELLGQLREVGRRANATLYMTLLGAFQVLLHRYSGEQDLWVGTPIANRMRQEWAGLIGFFSNTLVMRTEVTGDLPFTEVLERVRATTLRAYAHQELPFERLVQELQPQRDLGRTPLFQVMFALEEAEVSRGSEIAGLRIQPEVLDNGTAKFDLALFMGESEAGLTARLEYNAGLFEPGTATLLLQHLERLLEAIAANAGERVARLDLLPPQERRQVVREWNATGRAYRGGRQLQELFEEQVRKDPQALALVCAGERLSYEELNRRANQLAHYLREQGVGADVRVGICVERSVEMVVGQLGVLKAGGAYVPLDAEYPPERLRYMLEDAQAPLLLTQARLLERLPEVAGVRRICLDTGWEEISRRPARNVERVGSTANLAYVIYTSGSTGQPKGVMVTHANLNNLAQWHGEAFGIGEQDRGSCVAGLGFDASVWEVWPYLVKGASLAVPAEPTRRDPEQLQEWLQAAGVTVAFIPTALAEVMLGQKWPAGIRLRTVLTGGDQLRRRPAMGLPWRLSNNYGPTEGTVVASSGWVEPENAQEAREGWEGQGGHEAQGSQGKRESRKVPSIGRPVANARLYVLDPEMNPVAVGVAGELYVGGAGVTRGYVGRGELTAERYVPDEFGGEAGGRLYRTGDRVRYRLDGQLEFLGRVDQQVKIRGYRIELGEIEAVLQGHARVREAVVAVRERGEERQLVAYVVRESEAASPAGVSIAELREYLRSKLPCYMVPEVVSFLEKLPLTANGKVDRKRLPEPQQQPEAEGYVAPRDATEELISGIWQELLGLPRISIHANFFELGGHSILATRAIARIRQCVSSPISISELFRHPTIASLSAEILHRDGLTPSQTDLPLVRQAREPQAGSEEFAGCYVFPASPGQQRLWFLHELNERSGSTYHVFGGLRLEGAVNVQYLTESIQRVVARHESLRTRLAMIHGELSQIIVPQLRVEVPYADLRHAAAEKLKKEIVFEVTERRFDLRHGPLIRASVVRLEDQVYELIIATHHVICDGWSVNLFIADLMEEYRGLSEGVTGKLRPLTVQYADFSVAQSRWLASSRAADELAYWRQKLDRPAPLLNLPTRGARPAIQNFRGATEVVVLPLELAQQLRRLGNSAGATMYMTLLAAFNILLYKYTGARDIWIGTPVANRLHPELQNLLGFFVNTLVLRTELEPELAFAAALQRVRQTVVDAYEHQQLPFEKLVQELHPERELGLTPLFQVMFLMEEVLEAKGGVSGLNVTPLRFDSTTAKFDLTLSMAEKSDGLVARIEYNCDLFDGHTVAGMLGHLGVLLRKIAAEPERRLRELSLLAEEERQRILNEWQAPHVEYPRRRLPELFEEQAACDPEAVAVVFENQGMTYGELNRRANQLAHFLMSKGLGPETRVGICLERSPEMIVALFGVLKAGGVYVPLDPGYPRERLDWLLEDGQISLLLTQSALQKRCQGGQAQVICIDEEIDEIGGHSAVDPMQRTADGNLAYVIYTSGSTGKPKGVAITHRSANVLIHWAREAFSSAELQSVLASTSICFDLSVFEIFVPLSWGGKIVLARNNALDLAAAGAVAGAEPTLINTVPSAMTELLRLQAIPSSVITINLAGEALQRNLVDQAYAVEHVKRVINLYGPSEDTTYSTYEWVKAGVAGTAVPIGRPITNTKAYVLDADEQMVPAGVIGELYLAGEGLARGYLNRPDLTAERFLPDPFSPEGGQRLYRTGDLVRWNEQGSMEFLGRIDHQVKMRGYRIEMGEIESRLLEQGGIKQAVAVVRGSAAEQRLVAYVEAQDPVAELNVDGLRENLRRVLPGYMIPEVIVQLPQLPLTSNGKVDRGKLPEPERGEDARAGYSAPRDAQEEILCGILAAVLRVDSVGIRDDFFEMGGHSLLATRVISRIRDIFRLELPLSSVFAAPTAAGLAQSLRAARNEQGSVAPPLVPVRRSGDVPLSYAQHRLWMIDQLQPGTPAYNIAGGLRLEGTLQLEGLRWGLNEIIRRHESLRTTFPLRNGSPVQQINPTAPVTIQNVALPGHTEGDRRMHLLTEARGEANAPFDVEQGPLVRVKLFEVHEQEHVLLITTHHLISDGWSLGVMVGELTQLYQAWLENTPAPLLPLKLQYADYTVWQRQWMQGETLDSQLSYWRKQLEDLPVLALLADHPRPPVLDYRGATIKIEWSRDLTERLKQLSRATDVTLFMTLLAAFQLVLGRYAGQDDVAIGTGVANRKCRETEELVGFFVNTLVLRTRLHGNPTFTELLQRVRQVTLEAYQHQDAPFEKVVDALNPERDLGQTPLFQVMLMFQNVQTPELQLPGLRVSGFDTEVEAAKCDLMLTLQESAGTLSGELTYASAFYEAATIRRLVGHLEQVLQSVAQAPDQRIGEIPLLTDSELRTVVSEWNSTVAEYPQADGRQLQELIEEQVARSPLAEAVRYEDQRLSYSELNERANQLAHYLREQGVGADVRVGICVERSVEMVVGLLGILKAGGVYVPLDLEYPQERLKYMLADAKPTLLLAQERAQNTLTRLGVTEVLYLDRDWAAVGARPVTNLARVGSPDNLAYLIYTSGSTGQPKGVMVPHRGIVNRLLWMQEEYQLTAADRVLQKTPFSFDVSVWEFFWPLLTGASLVLCAPARHGDSEYLAQLIQRERVTTLHFVPSMLNQFLQVPGLEECTSVRQVMCSGEALPAAVQKRFFERMKAKLHNLYGPTEASVDVTYWQCESAVEDRSVPIGRPVANTQIYILDEYLNPVPSGVKGDLYIGGVQLARGYQNRPDLTATTFIPDRFSSEVGRRLYKTGDVARFRTDGNVEYLGRSDFQVKVRGFRIELGEIETALQAHPRIKEAVVVARGGPAADQQLVAYLVDFGDGPPDVAELKGYLRDRLPAHMVPAQFIHLGQMPLSKNGKVDRKSLPDPGSQGLQIEQQYVEPSTAQEKILAAVLSQVLGLERIGIHDNFFNLGGDSIRSLQVITGARAQGLRITLQQLFRTPTIQGMAAHSTWLVASAVATTAAPLPRPFRLIADSDRAKLPTRRVHRNSPR